MTDQYIKGTYVSKYLEGLDVHPIHIAEAVSDRNYQKSYQLIQDNPKITNIKTIWSTQITIYLVK